MGSDRKPLRVRLPEFPTPPRVVMDNAASSLTPVVRFYFDAALSKSEVAAVFQHLLGGVKEENGRYVHALPATHPKLPMAFCEFVEMHRVGDEIEVVATYNHRLGLIYSGVLIHERNRVSPRPTAMIPPSLTEE